MAGNGRVDLVQPSSGVVWNGARCGWYVAMGTLLGPERTTEPTPGRGRRLRTGMVRGGVVFRCQAQPGFHTVLVGRPF